MLIESGHIAEICNQNNYIGNWIVSIGSPDGAICTDEYARYP